MFQVTRGGTSTSGAPHWRLTIELEGLRTSLLIDDFLFHFRHIELIYEGFTVGKVEIELSRIDLLEHVKSELEKVHL